MKPMIPILHPKDPFVMQADAIIAHVRAFPDHEDFVKHYAGDLWGTGLDLLDMEDEEDRRWGYLWLLKAISLTPLVSPARARELVALGAAFPDEDMWECLQDYMKRDPHPSTAALDAQVRPLLAWLDR